MSLTENPELPAAVFGDAVLDTLVPSFPPGALDELRSRVRGPVLAAGDDGLAAEVATWNVAVQHTPAVAVGATCAADVEAAVAWAVAHDLRVAVQATGHGPVRNAAGALMITTRRMQGLSIDPERRMARVEAGVKWMRVQEAAAEFGLAGLCGSSSDVGVVGYTLGGGMGSLGRKHGFAADHVQAVEIVTADGRLRRVSVDSEPELFWAVRGGKGNLGIVTALEFGLVPVPSLFGGGIFFAGDDAPALLHRFREWTPTLPEEVSTSIAILRMPPMEELPPPLRGQTVVHLRYAYAGADHAEAERLLSPMKIAGTILLGHVGPMRTDEMDAIHMDPVDPVPAWEKGMLLRELAGETVEALLAAAGPQVEVPLIMAELRLMGGALGRPAAVPNAVPGRSGAYGVFLLGPGIPELAQIVPAVGRGVLAALEPWAAPEKMVNFLGDVSGPEEVAAAYPPATRERLREVKRAVDPAGVFTFGHAI
ncbi:FAD-binding oxidoreductase [Blastococcus deserti]|uniref:FAD-binding oxidoreductase n=1 Tax=Blastococcus deserti TaxID=2259033 RepID=A0ABW4XB60_9ACTN